MFYFFKKIKYLLLPFIVFLFFYFPLSAKVEVKETFPRLANYYLKWELNSYEAENLAKWDLLILDMEVQENSPEAIKKIRQLNPDVIILDYITSQEVMDDLKYYHLSSLRDEFKKGLDESWYLKDENGNKITNWPGTHMLNLSNKTPLVNGNRFNDYLPEFVANKIKSSGLWDGVFYDNTWGDIAWINGANIDLDNNRQKESSAEINQLWVEGSKRMLQKTRELCGNDFLIVGNGKIYDGYQRLVNGMMFENFPSSWEGDGTWAGSMANYLKLPNLNSEPSIPIINTYNKNQNNFNLVRFTLGSTLLGEGFYSYDYDTSNHTKLWWYDEYNLDLGEPISAAYNPLNRQEEINNGLFRRDFENGSVFVNASNKRQIQIFSQESFSKPKGDIDPAFNNGERLNFLDLGANSGAILLNNDRPIKNAIFTNGFFYRFFDAKGSQVKSANFSFINSQAGSSEVIILSNNNGETIISAYNGLIKIIENGKERSFRPFPLFKGELSLGISEKNGKLDKIIVGPGQGGGPQVLIFNSSGKLEANFFAYDKKFRGGVNVSLSDLDGDNNLEIITAPGRGAEPLVKVFGLSGNLKFSFLAYDKNFRGGVDLASGDMNKDGRGEIVTIPSSGGGPQVRVFNSEGKVVGGFFAYDKNLRDKFKIALSDISGNGNLEILVGRQNPY